MLAMKSKRTKPVQKKSKHKTKKAGVARRIDIAPVAIAAAVALTSFVGFAAWQRLSDVTKPVMARMDDAALAREIDRAVAAGRVPDIGAPLFAVPAQAAETFGAETGIDPGISARAKIKAAAEAETEAKTEAKTKAPAVARRHKARKARVARRQSRAARDGRGRDAMAAVSTNELIAEARKYLGGNPTGWSRDWCGRFLDMILKKTGHKGGGNLARGYIHYGTRLAGPQVGAIAVFSRKGGGHVGIVTGIDANGNPIVISGNYNDRVAIATYPAGRVLAYVRPAQ
jgi:uncharacterized protein (TIGR02594 family)